jgi:hypothetical protein
MVGVLFLSLLHASSVEDKLKTVFLGKFAHFTQWPQKNSERFVITVIEDTPFSSMLIELYKDKKIHNKPIIIRHANSVEDIDQTDILYVAKMSPTKQMDLIAYAKENHILTVSENSGFAERGGIIQFYFVKQKVRLKINYSAAQASQLKMSSSLLSIAQVIKDK